MSDKSPLKIVVSYSRQDKPWLVEFQTHIAPFVQRGTLEVWDETQISTGDNKKAVTLQAFTNADVIVLLVTPSFLASDVMTKPEFSKLLADKRVFWIAVSASNYEETEIDNYEPANAPELPLDHLTRPRRDAKWIAICKKLAALAPVSPGQGRPNPNLPPVHPLSTLVNPTLEASDRLKNLSSSNLAKLQQILAETLPLSAEARHGMVSQSLSDMPAEFRRLLIGRINFASSQEQFVTDLIVRARETRPVAGGDTGLAYLLRGFLTKIGDIDDRDWVSNLLRI